MTNLTTLPFVTEDDVRDTVTFTDAINALESALQIEGMTAHTPLRTRTDLPHGHLLSMPSQVGDAVGVKLVSVSSQNASRRLPRIQGLLVLSDALTLTPRALFDAAGLTILRTAALSALAVRHLASADASTLVVFGSGPQAWGHVEALRTVRPLTDVVVVGRSAEPAQDLVDRITASGLKARTGSPNDVAQADIVACCTSSSAPVFDSALLQDTATVVAMGSHSPQEREVDAGLVGRAFVVVETFASAMAEAGDIILACQDGVPADTAIDAEIASIVQDSFTPPSGPSLFKGVGEAWADIAVASCAAQRLGLHSPAPARSTEETL